MLSYLMKVILMYSLVFAGIFHLVRTTKSIEGYARSASLATVFLMLTFLGTQAVRFTLGWVDIPDGRYLMVAFAGYYLGFWPLVAMIATMLTVNALVLPYRLFGLFVIKYVLGMVFYGLGRRYYRRSRALGQNQMIVAVVLIVLIPLLLSNYFFPSDGYVGLANENLIVIILATAVIVYTVFRSVNVEIERELFIRNILGLNEELTATEETLRENYGELEKYKNQVEYYAFHDAKTGFYNSDYLMYTLQSMDRTHREPYCLLSVKICDMGDYKEKLGQMLLEMMHFKVGVLLQGIIESLGLHNSISLYVVSYGNFVTMSRHVSREALEYMVSEVDEKLQRFEVAESVVLNLSLAIGGLEIGREDSFTAEEQIEFVEIAALECSERQNGYRKALNITWFYPELLEAKQFRSRLSIDLSHNLKLEEFYVVFQPEYDAMKRIVGSEALLRWRHGELGNISPAVFIDLAERQGMIHKLGAFVQEQVMAFQSRCLIQFPERPLLPIAINVSLIELMDSDYCDNLLNRLNYYGLNPSAIILEITESSVLNKLEDVFRNIEKLGRAGVEIQLDDFGTGYASISHLNMFPLSVIKIDKTFIDDLADEEMQKTKTVVSSMIDMAHRLELPVVAEGVETEGQFEILKTLGCDMYQGYYLSKPLEAVDYMMLIDSWGAC